MSLIIIDRIKMNGRKYLQMSPLQLLWYGMVRCGKSTRMIGLLRCLDYIRKQFSVDKNHVNQPCFIISFSAAICKLIYTNDLLSKCVLISPMHSFVLLKARLANPGFQALQVPRDLRECQELQEHQEHQELYLGDGNSVLGNMMDITMAETMAKYM